MNKRLLFLADQDEVNLIHLTHCAQDRKVPYRLLSLGHHDGSPVSAWINNERGSYWVTDTMGQAFSLDEIACVWSRGMSAPTQPAVGTPENLAYHEWLACWRHLVQAIGHCFWMNDLESIRQSSSRLNQMAIARQHGFAVPETLVTNEPVHAKDFLRRLGRVVIKHICAGSASSMGDRSQFTVALNQEEEAVLEQVRYCPTLLQECVDKAVELRVTVVGDQVFAAAIESSADQHTSVDSRKWVETDLTYFRARLGDNINERIVAIVRQLGLEYGAVDFIARPDGELVFLEVNPSGQWGFVEMASGYAITEAIVGRLQEQLHA